MVKKKTKKLQNNRKLIRVITAIVTGVAMIGLGVLSYLQMQKNNAIQQKINQVQIADKVEYAPVMTTTQVETQKELLEARMNEFLKDEMTTNYDGYKKARNLLRSIFFASSTNLDTATETNSHDDLVEFYKDYSYTIDDISGAYVSSNNENYELYVKLTVKQGDYTVHDGIYYSIKMDNNGHIIGGAVYGE